MSRIICRDVFQGTGLCNCGEWLSESKICGASMQEGKMMIRLQPHGHDLNFVVQRRAGRKIDPIITILKTIRIHSLVFSDACLPQTLTDTNYISKNLLEAYSSLATESIYLNMIKDVHTRSKPKKHIFVELTWFRSKIR